MWDDEDRAFVLLVVGITLIIVALMTVGVAQGIALANDETYRQFPSWATAVEKHK